MSVQNIILGELIRMDRRAYGYELRDRLEDLFSDVLGLSDAAVYQALRALRKSGDLRRVGGVDDVRREAANPRVYYAVTDKGRVRYRKWMDRPAKKTPLREELHMQLMSADAEDIPRLIEALRSFEEQCRIQLREIMAIPLGTPAAKTARGRSFGAAIVQTGMVDHLQTSMEWAQRSRRDLQRVFSHPTGLPGRHRP